MLLPAVPRGENPTQGQVGVLRYTASALRTTVDGVLEAFLTVHTIRNAWRGRRGSRRYGPSTWNGGINPKLVTSKVSTSATGMFTGGTITPWQHRLGDMNVP